MSIGQIAWINILLSGDNAVVIALACRSLVGLQRRLGIIFGAGAAVVLRIVLTALAGRVLEVPFLAAIGGVALIWIAVKLVLPQEDSEGEDKVAGHDTLWRAIVTVAVADAIMSLDNVLAIAAAAHRTPHLMAFGLILSIPIVVVGSSLITAIISRAPLLVWAGGALLGWIAGDMVASDEGMAPAVGPLPPLVFAAGGAALVVALALAITFFRPRKAPKAAEAEARPVDKPRSLP